MSLRAGPERNFDIMDESITMLITLAKNNQTGYLGRTKCLQLESIMLLINWLCRYNI